MELPVLAAPARGEGCVNRFVETVNLGGELGEVQLIVSGCQMGRFTLGIEAKLAEVRGSGLGRDAMQEQLQSWIDGGSPCDMPFADPGDRLPLAQALMEEMRYFAQRSGADIPPGMEGPSVIVFEIRSGPPGIVESPFRKRPRRWPRFITAYLVVLLLYVILQVIRAIWQF